EAEPILADGAEHRDASRAEGDQIVRDGAAGAGRDLGGNYTDARNTGLARRLGHARVVIAPAVQADIPDHQGVRDGELRQQVGEVHLPASSRTARRRAGKVARWSPQK